MEVFYFYLVNYFFNVGCIYTSISIYSSLFISSLYVVLINIVIKARVPLRKFCNADQRNFRTLFANGNKDNNIMALWSSNKTIGVESGLIDSLFLA